MCINFLPVFYHVPKNSGTYVYNSILNDIRLQISNKVKILIVMEKKYILSRFIVCDKTNFIVNSKKCSQLKNSGAAWTIDISDFTTEILTKVTVLSVFIESKGFRQADKILDIISKSNKLINFYKFIILREPFSRELSLFHYLNSDKSNHELSHGKVKILFFENYITSDQVHDSWIIRALLNIPHESVLTEENFLQACSLLESFNVYDITDTEKAISEALTKCLNISHVALENFNKKNENSYRKILLKDLSAESQKSFKERKHYDIKLYERFINMPRKIFTITSKDDAKKNIYNNLERRSR